MSISFEQISKRYGANTVLNDVSLQIESGEFFVLLGPSGSGKSTLLRAAAGLTDVDHGLINFHGRDVTHLPARERGVGLVFQHYALFRHMTVGENVEFALRVRGVKRAARAQRCDELLALVALEGYATRLPGQLSGGQQQRVAVARALAHEPAVLLLDEPFGALDARIRVELRETIRQVQRRLGMTTILVTHDQEEAFALGDRIGVMNQGRLLEIGRPEILYRHPATRFVATFLGAANLFLGEIDGAGLGLGTARFRSVAGDDRHEVVAVVRPEDVEIATEEDRLHSQRFASGHVQSASFGGSQQRVHVQLAPDAGVVSAVAGDGDGSAAGLVEVTRTGGEQAGLALAPGRHVVLGLRRIHLLPTPISSFRLAGVSTPAAAEALRRAPLLLHLAASMRAPIIDAEPSGRKGASRTDAPQLGVAVLPASVEAIPAIAAAIRGGARRLLCLPADTRVPRRVVIGTVGDAVRPATLALVASVMRHLQAEVTLVAVQPPLTARADVANAFRHLLNARAELLETHGLDIRTEVLVGVLEDWITGVATTEEATLIVLGLEGSADDIERALTSRFHAVLGGRAPLLISCTSPGAAGATVPFGALVPDGRVSGAGGSDAS